MAFIVSRKDVGYFGYLCDRRLMLFHSPFGSCELSSEAPVILTAPVGDGASTKVVELEKNLAVESAKQNKKYELNCAAISNCGTLIVTSDDNKHVHLWRRCDNQWSLVSSRTVTRKCLHILFTNSGSNIIAADRGGDVFSFSVNEANECGKLILGHVCVILAVELTDDDKYIITSDRDAKIRVSHYPNSYNIAAYCLGHLEFVSALKVYCSSEKLLFSGSGDGTLRLWKYDEGTEILCCDLTSNADLFPNSNSEEMSSISSGGDTVVRTDVHAVATPDESIASTAPDIVSDPQLKKVAVKCIKYCSKTQVFAMLFYTHSQIAIFKVDVLDCDEIQFAQYLNFKSPPQDAYFDGSGYLWVLLSSKEESYVAIFKSSLRDGSEKFQELEDVDSSKVEKICSEISNNWRAFSASIHVNNLYKRSYIGGFKYGKRSHVKEGGSEQKLKKTKVK